MSTLLRLWYKDCNNIGFEGAMEIAHALRENNTLTTLDLGIIT